LWLELIGAVFVSMIVTNFATTIFFQMAWEGTIEPRFRTAFAERGAHAVTAVLLAENDEVRSRLIKGLSGPGQRLSISSAPDLSATASSDLAMVAMVKRVEPILAGRDIRISQLRGKPNWRFARNRDGKREEIESPPPLGIGVPSIAVMTISVQGDNGTWINADFDLPVPFSPVFPLMMSLGVLVVMLVIVSFWMSRRIVRPLKALENAASAMGHGDPPSPVPESGPRAVKAAIHAFNTMSQRLLAALDSQRTIMAAVAHDLRSPITSLRLRTEFVSDAETKERMLETLAEMETMTEAVIDLVRAGKSSEEARLLDLGALADSLVQDIADTGSAVSFEPGAEAHVMLRRSEVARALRNLIENAVRYAGSARVSLAVEKGFALVHIDDEGPGVPEDQLEALFMPFARLETSRNKETGGHGLGLTIARMVARGHGGDVTLHNRAPKGLRATLRLPLSA
jgi:signal transduction histidine kinase